MDIRLGYACLNTSLPIKMKTLRLRSFHEKGVEYMKSIILHNLQYLKQCLLWNVEHNIQFFRISSDMIPLATHPEMNFIWHQDQEIINACRQLRNYSEKHGMRITMHPGQYTLLNSPRKEVVTRSIEDLKYHEALSQLLGVSDLIIHVGGIYDDKKSAIERWVKNYQQLPENLISLLRLENDQHLYNIEDVLQISERTGIPVVMDFHHHKIFPSLNMQEALHRVIASWEGFNLPKFHLSSAKGSDLDPRHADFIALKDFNEVLENLKNLKMMMPKTIYLMLEAKQKEQAVLRLIREFLMDSCEDNFVSINPPDKSGLGDIERRALQVLFGPLA